MTPPALATITGECWGNQGGAFPGALIFTPVSLEARDGPALVSDLQDLRGDGNRPPRAGAMTLTTNYPEA